MSERLDFLQEKAENFRAFLLGHSPDAELAARIDGFRPDQLWTTLTTLFLPAVATIGIEGVANEMLSHLTPARKGGPRKGEEGGLRVEGGRRGGGFGFGSGGKF